jgi:hypothetical protein
LDGVEILRQVTRDVVFEMATWELYVVQRDHASSAIFATSWLLARMIARFMSALTGLFTLENLMHSFGMTSRLTSVSAIWETVHTGFPATTFRAKLSKVVWLLDLNRSVQVSRAAEVQIGAHGVLGLQHIDDLLPHWHVRVCVSVANEVQAVLGTAQENIDAIRGLKKSDFPIFIASNQRDDDDLGLFALKIIDSGHAEKIA